MKFRPGNSLYCIDKISAVYTPELSYTLNFMYYKNVIIFI